MAKGKVAQVMRDVRSGGAARGSGRSARRGFTLVEVVVASAILLILLISLMGSFASGVSGFRQAQLMTFAQNLAEFQAEDLKARAPSVLKSLCEGKYGDVLWNDVPPGVDPSYTNYPSPSATSTDPSEAAAAANDAYPFEYDSGPRQTDYFILGVTDVVLDRDTQYDPVYHAGETTAPNIPTDPPLLLGSNISVEKYDQTDVAGPTTYPYVIRLHKEAYPLFTKQIRVVCYDAETPVTTDPWDPAISPGYHFMSAAGLSRMDTYVDDSRALYAYVITVRYKMGGTERVLFETRGVIAAPYSPPS